jgi:hypothetical protein
MKQQEDQIHPSNSSNPTINLVHAILTMSAACLQSRIIPNLVIQDQFDVS